MPPDSEDAQRFIRAVEVRKQPEGGSSPEVGLAYALTDQGNGRRLAVQHGDDLRYVADNKKWLVWGECGKGAVHWVVDNTGEVMRRAKQVAIDIANPNGAINLKQAELDEWSRKSQDSGALRAIVELGRSEWPIPATPDQFDSDPMLFGVGNGTLNLATGEFYESRREDLITKCGGATYVASGQWAVGSEQEESKQQSAIGDQPATLVVESQTRQPVDDFFGPECDDCGAAVATAHSGGCKYWPGSVLVKPRDAITHKPSALCPAWESFLHVVMDDDEEMIQFLQRCVGYSMTGLVKERVLLILYGGGANGKSTFIETLHALMGDYASLIPIDSLLNKKFGGSQIPNDIAMLKGVRFVSASEPDESAKLATGKIKHMTGGGKIMGRFMGAEFFSFQTQFKLWFETNHKPRIDDSSKAMFDRLRLIPFKVRIPEEKQDKELKAKLLAELSGILNWALAGLKQYQEIGLAPPAKVMEETARYQREQDILGTFIADRYEEREGSLVSKEDFHREWVTWCKEVGEFAVSKNTLGRRMNDRNFDPDKRGYVTPGGKLERVWEGLKKRDLPAVAHVPGNASHPPTDDDFFGGS